MLINKLYTYICVHDTVDMCNFLISEYCRLDVLDLSWNVIGEKGAIIFSNLLPSNTTLTELNLASNGIGDIGGQRIIKSLKHHACMAKFNVSQNDIADGSCFVVAQVNTYSFIIFNLVLRICYSLLFLVYAPT